jgi:hypothetical protein
VGSCQGRPRQGAFILTLDSSPCHLQSSWERSATQFSWASFHSNSMGLVSQLLSFRHSFRKTSLTTGCMTMLRYPLRPRLCLGINPLTQRDANADSWPSADRACQNPRLQALSAVLKTRRLVSPNLRFNPVPKSTDFGLVCDAPKITLSW